MVWSLTGHCGWRPPPWVQTSRKKAEVAPFLWQQEAASEQRGDASPSWATPWLPGALSSRHPSVAAALTAHSPESSTCLWWQKQAPGSPHRTFSHSYQKPSSDCLQHLINLGSEPPFSHGCFPPPTLTKASLTKGCIGGCVQSCSWYTICPLPLLLLLSVSTWIALPSHRPCHF